MHLQVSNWFKFHRQKVRARGALDRELPFPRVLMDPNQRLIQHFVNFLTQQLLNHSYKVPNGQRPDWWICKICLNQDNYTIRSAIAPCGHVACTECIGTIVRDAKVCPICREKIDGVYKMYE